MKLNLIIPVIALMVLMPSMAFALHDCPQGNFDTPCPEHETQTQFVLPFDVSDILNQGTLVMVFVILVVGVITVIVIKHIKQR